MPIRVSTIIPSYNSAGTIAAAIDSALAQEIADHEVIVVNDGSTDDTAKILAGYGDRIVAINQTNLGSNRSRNPGIARARGEYLAFLDSDDIWLPGRLEHTCTALDRNPNAVLSFTDVIPMDPDGALGAPWVVGGAPELSDLMTRGWSIFPSAVTMRRSVAQSCGGFPSELTNLGDCFLWMRAREMGKFIYVTEPLTIYRTVNFDEIGDRYCGGFRRGLHMISGRYGRAANPFVTYMSDVLAGSLVTKAIRQMNDRRIGSACWTTARAFFWSPSYFVRNRLVHRMLSLGNLRRLRDAWSRPAAASDLAARKSFE